MFIKCVWEDGIFLVSACYVNKKAEKEWLVVLQNGLPIWSELGDSSLFTTIDTWTLLSYNNRWENNNYLYNIL